MRLHVIDEHSSAGTVDPDIKSTLDNSADDTELTDSTGWEVVSQQFVNVLSESLSSEQHAAQSLSSSSSGEVDCDDDDDDDDDAVVNSSSWRGLRAPSVTVD